MHNMIGSTGMDQESHAAHDESYSHQHWVDMNAYNHLSMSGYATGGSNDYYIPSTTHGLPSESIGGHMPPPLPQPIQPPPHQHHRATHHYGHQPHLPHPLIIPTQSPHQMPWPSTRTNPGVSYSAPPMPIPARPTMPLKQVKLPSMAPSQGRKTLTLEDRKAMCQYAEDNPHVKQTEIGQKFGVERSTVSKVLGNKEKWLYQEERSSSPIKRPKSKNADIERTLVNWVRNQQKKGLVVSDSDMEEKAKTFFAHTDTRESAMKTITPIWLEKFKQRHGIGPGRMIRRASETAVPDKMQMHLDSPASTHTPGGVSPNSPSGRRSSQDIPTEQSPEIKDETAGFDFQNSGYRLPSASTTSLPSATTESSNPNFSGGTFSPASQFTFSPDPNTGLFDSRIPPGASGSQRPRSQTFPNIELDYANQQEDPAEPQTPKYNVPVTSSLSALESSTQDMSGTMFGMDPAISPHSLHSHSNSSLGTRSSNTPVLTNTAPSLPSSPTQEDARKAADTLLTFIQSVGNHGLVNHDELNTVKRLTEKLKPYQQPQHGPRLSSFSTGIGGLTRIPEGDHEMSAVSNSLVKNEPAMIG